MKITNLVKFEKAVKTLANFCTYKKKQAYRPYHETIFVIDSVLYSTDGKILAIIDANDFIQNEGNLAFPSKVKAKRKIEMKENKFFVDGKENSFSLPENFDMWKSIKRILPDYEPSAELSFDFSEYNLSRVGMGNKVTPYVTFFKDKAIFNFCDEVETICEIEDCFSKGLLDFDYEEFEEVNFSMKYIFSIMKISKKFKIIQYDLGDAKQRKIVAGDYEFLIMPMKPMKKEV